MKQDIARTKQQAKQVELSTTPRQPGVRRYAKKVARKAVSRERKLQRYLESDERVDKPRESWQMKLEFDRPVHLAHKAIALEELSVGYPGGEPLIQNISAVVHSGMRIALVGPNGCGKTTLLRTMTGLLEPLAGKVALGSGVRLGYMSQEQELLEASKSALQIIQEAAPFNDTDARSFLHYYLFTGDDPLRQVSTLSYGERARLSLALLVARGSNFLLLDEPVNHLDIPSRARFEQALRQFDGTVLAVVHDRYFIEQFANQVWEVREGGLLCHPAFGGI
jgi:ATP-binding cassette subfamily F protein 3